MSGQLERLLAQASEPRSVGFASPLWHQAYEVCDGDRGEMWDWLEERYLETARLLVDAMARLKSHNCPRKLGYQLRVKEVARDTYRQVSEPEELPVESCPVCVLLARFAEVEQQAGEGQG